MKAPFINRFLLMMPVLASLLLLHSTIAHAQITLIYSNSFNDTVGTTYPGWSSSVVAYTNNITTPGSGTLPAPVVANTDSKNHSQRFLGLFGGPAIGGPSDPGWNKTRVFQTISLSLSNLPAHAALQLTFDLYVIMSWDGDSPAYGPDRFILSVAGGPTLLVTTFSNNPKTNTDGSYQSYPVPHSAPWTGAISVGTLGYASFFRDSIYRLQYTFAHTNTSVRIDFSSSLFEGKGTGDEAWGLDNVIVKRLAIPKRSASTVNVLGMPWAPADGVNCKIPRFHQQLGDVPRQRSTHAARCFGDPGGIIEILHLAVTLGLNAGTDREQSL